MPGSALMEAVGADAPQAAWLCSHAALGRPDSAGHVAIADLMPGRRLSVAAVATEQRMVATLGHADAHALPQADVAVGAGMPLEGIDVRRIASEGGALARR